MSDPWPSAPWPNQINLGDTLIYPDGSQGKIVAQSIPTIQAAVSSLDEALMKWEAAKKALDVAKETEMECRKLAFELGFGKNATEGTNSLDLGNSYTLKGVKKLNYKLKAPLGFNGDTVDAVDATVARFAQISNEGPFIAERLFKYSVDLSIAEYRKLCEEAEYSVAKKSLLNEVNKILEITEASPTLEIKEPKAKKK